MNVLSTVAQGLPILLLDCLTIYIISEYFQMSGLRALLFQFTKKGDTQQPANHRPITLLSSLCKLYTTILCRRITEWATANYVFSEAQFGFRPTYSTVDACFALNLLGNAMSSTNVSYVVHL